MQAVLTECFHNTFPARLRVNMNDVNNHFTNSLIGVLLVFLLLKNQ